MGMRRTVQDATGILSDFEGDGGAFEGYSDATQAFPADSLPGFARGGCWYDFQTGNQRINVGTVTSSKIRLVSGFADSTNTIASYQSIAGYVKGAVLIDIVTGAMFTNIGTDTSSNFISQQISTQGFWQLPLSGFRIIQTNNIPVLAGTPASGIMAQDTSPKYIRINAATDKGLRVQWAASTAIEITTENLLTPPDMDVTKASSLNLIASMGGATDTPTVTANVFPGLGGVDFGAASGAITGTTIAVYPIALAANKFGGFGATGFASISLTPGAHTTDVLNLYGVYLQYQKQLMPA
jgi:hypothetical protein